MNSPFGYDLPPGVTNKDIDDQTKIACEFCDDCDEDNCKIYECDKCSSFFCKCHSDAGIGEEICICPKCNDLQQQEA